MMKLIPLPGCADNDIRMMHDSADALEGGTGDAAAAQAPFDAQGFESAAILVTRRPVKPAANGAAPDASARRHVGAVIAPGYRDIGACCARSEPERAPARRAAVDNRQRFAHRPAAALQPARRGGLGA
jgi:hypothetical protein